MRRLRFNEAGRLEDITDSGAEADSKLIMLDMWLASNAPTLFTLDEVQNIAKMTAIPKKTVDSWLRGCLKAGQLTSPRPGFYAKSPSQT
jgi:hypothetical protein